MDDRDYKAMNKHNYGNDFIADVISYVQGKKIIKYRTITTPERVQKLAERL